MKSRYHPTFCFVQLLVSLCIITAHLSLSSPVHPNDSSIDTRNLLLQPRDDLPKPTNNGGALRGSLIFYNGKIHTMDDAKPLASVVAIKDGTIIYVGDSREDALRKGSFGNPPPPSIDLRGRFTLPGLVDCHNHIVLMGNRPGYHTPLEYALSIKEVLSTYKTKSLTVPKGSFITTIGGFHPNQFAELRLPTLSELDEVLPNHPVFISIGFSGPATTNTLGKAYFTSPSITADLHPTIASNGTIPSGLDNNKALLTLRRNLLTPTSRKRSVQDTMTYAASIGITTHLDQGAFNATDTPSDLAASEDLYTFHNPWLSIYSDFATNLSSFLPKIRLRINFLHQDSSPSLPTLTQRLQNTFPFFGNDMVRTGGIGEFATDLPNYSSGPVLEAAMTKIAQSGWRYEAHSLDAIDFKLIINLWESVNAKFNITKLRWVLAHVPKITSEYIIRLKKLGGGVNLTSWLYLAGTGNFTNPAGPPFRTIVDSGIPAGFGGDGAQIAPLSPWPHIYYAVTGKNAKGEVINYGQIISRAEALRLYTRENNWFLGGPDEGRLGVLEEGRLGDVIVLSEDYFEVEVERLKKLRSVLTVVGGVVVYEE